MKKILITGANSYIGSSFAAFAAQWPEQVQIDTADVKDNRWRGTDFSPYDAVLHVAGIAHIKETKENAPLYYAVNRDLAIEVAKISKSSGVRQFIFLSSASVYGMVSGKISKDTAPNPKTHYGTSKLQAEEEIAKLACDHFAVAILRPPMVYGKGCKGNFQTLQRYAKILPVFPDIENQRSMIHIDNLSCYIWLLIQDGKGGLFFPQDADYICTSKMVKAIADATGHAIKMTKAFNGMIRIVPTGLREKVFGSLTYETALCEDYGFCVTSFPESVRRSIG